MSEPIGPYERVQQKAHDDADFRAALVADPRSAMKDTMGIVVPEAVEVTVVENTARHLTLVLPHVADEGDLDFEEEDEVVGFSYHNANFSKNVMAEPPVLNSFHNANFSRNFSALGSIDRPRFPPPNK